MLLVPLQSAQAQPERAQSLYEQAREYFDQGYFIEAADLFGQAFEIDPHPAILYNQARCFQELGDLTRALGLFRQTLTLHPTERIRTEVQSRIEAIQSQLVESGFHLADLDPVVLVDLVKLSITSLPDGAQVALNQEGIGITPIEDLYIAPGTYQLTVSLEGYQPHLRTLEVEPGRNLSVHAGLRRVESVPTYQPPQPGIIEVVGPTQGMQVFLDAELLGLTPVLETEIPPGRYRLTVRQTGYYEWSTEIEVQSGDTAHIFADAQRIPGSEEEDVGFTYQDWGIVTLVGGSAVLATGIVFGVLAKADADRYHRNVNAPNRDGIRDVAITEALVADLSYGVAVGLLAASLILFLVDSEEQEGEWERIPDDLVWIDTRSDAAGWSFSIALGRLF